MPMEIISRLQSTLLSEMGTQRFKFRVRVTASTVQLLSLPYVMYGIVDILLSSIICFQPFDATNLGQQ